MVFLTFCLDDDLLYEIQFIRRSKSHIVHVDNLMAIMVVGLVVMVTLMLEQRDTLNIAV